MGAVIDVRKPEIEGKVIGAVGVEGILIHLIKPGSGDF